MQGFQRKFGQSPSQDNLQILQGYPNQTYFPNQSGNNPRMATPPPPNSQQKMGTAASAAAATTIQGTGVKIMNNPKFSSSMKAPPSSNTSNGNIAQMNGLSNGSQVASFQSSKIVDVNRKLHTDNESLKDRIKETEAKGKQSQFDYSKQHIDVSSYILTNYSKFCDLLNELHEAKNQHHDETKKNKQIKEINEQIRSRQPRGGLHSQQNTQELQEQSRQMELNRQIESTSKENSQLDAQQKAMETAFQSGQLVSQSNPIEKGFQSAEEKAELQEKANALSQNITKLTQQMEDLENKKKEYTTNNSKKNFFSEYDQMGRQVQAPITSLNDPYSFILILRRLHCQDKQTKISRKASSRRLSKFIESKAKNHPPIFNKRYTKGSIID